MGKDSHSHSSSPKRKTAGKQGKHPVPPPGFTRSTCGVGHACHNPLCYRSVNDPTIFWDKKASKKPYYPPGKSKYDIMDLQFDHVARKKQKKLKKQYKKDKHRKAINKELEELSNDADKFKKVVDERGAKLKLPPTLPTRRVKRPPGRMQDLKDKGFLIPGTPEYEAEIRRLKDEGILHSEGEDRTEDKKME